MGKSLEAGAESAQEIALQFEAVRPRSLKLVTLRLGSEAIFLESPKGQKRVCPLNHAAVGIGKWSGEGGSVLWLGESKPLLIGGREAQYSYETRPPRARVHAVLAGDDFRALVLALQANWRRRHPEPAGYRVHALARQPMRQEIDMFSLRWLWILPVLLFALTALLAESTVTLVLLVFAGSLPCLGGLLLMPGVLARLGATPRTHHLELTNQGLRITRPLLPPVDVERDDVRMHFDPRFDVLRIYRAHDLVLTIRSLVSVQAAALWDVPLYVHPRDFRLLVHVLSSPAE